MEKWQNFYIQRMGEDTESDPYPVYESVSDLGIWCKDIPFKLFEKVKTPAVRTWADEHGDDEYIPSTGLYLESYTMQVEFGCKKTSTVDNVRLMVGQFLSYLRSSGMLKIYSSYTRIGRQDVRLSSVGNEVTWKTSSRVDGGTEEFAIFTVEFKVNDPVSDVAPLFSDGVITNLTTSS